MPQYTDTNEVIRMIQWLDAIRESSRIEEVDLNQKTDSGRSVEDMEAWFVRTWERLFGKSGIDIDIDDDFFALGGTSLDAMDMIVRLRRELGVNVPTSIMLEASTPRMLAALIVGRNGARQDSHAYLYGGGAVDGQRVGDAIICLHGEMEATASRLPDHIAMYMLPPHGFDGLPPPRTFDGMVEDYLRRIIEIQPLGPYVIAGYSFGGAIAHEVACRMLQSGLEVRLLMMIDCGDPAGMGCEPGLLSSGEILEQRIEESGPLDSWDERHQLFLAGLHRAAQGYRPGRFDGPVVFYRAAESEHDKVECWRERCGGAFRVVEVPGDHRSMLHEENADALACGIVDEFDNILGVNSAVVKRSSA